MIFTSKMLHVSAVVLRDHADAVSRALLQVGSVHFNRLRDVAPVDSRSDALHERSVGERRMALSELRGRIESLLSLGKLSPPVLASADVHAEGSPQPIDAREANEKLDRLARDVEQFRKRQSELQQEINRISDLTRGLSTFRGGPSPGSARAEISGSSAAELVSGESRRFLTIRYGVVAAGQIEPLDRALGRYSALLVRAESGSDEPAVLVVYMKRVASDVGELLREHGFRETEPPGRTEELDQSALDHAQERLAELRAEQAEQNTRLVAVIESERESLEERWRDVRVEELLLSIQGTTSESKHAAVFTGWVPVRHRGRVEQAVLGAAEGACYLEWHNADELADNAREQGRPALTPPVELRNPRFLSPFQMLVTNFGIPAYRTVDPTPLVAIAYLLMFGLMFGDAGHGLVLVIIGVIGRAKIKSLGMRSLSTLLIWCGGASIVMGVLFGAYFGYRLLPPLWFDYHGVVAGHPEAGAVRNIMDILTITVYLGVAVIGAGLLLNWINLIRTRKWLPLLFDKAGVLGGVIYAGGVWAAAVFAQSGFRTLPDLAVVGPLIGVPAVLLFLKAPLEALVARRAGSSPHGGPGMWVMDWVLELLEVFSGYLANTLSFMRVAGLGIAHVMLMVAFFQIAEMVSPSGTSILSIIVLLVGNVIVIGLEGLSAGIQSLRLNYYEFFSKYFVPSGKAYRPVSLG